MSIKSEKAREIIEREGRMDFTMAAYSIAQKAVIQAESDADELYRAELMESQDYMMKIYDKKIIDIKQGGRERAVRAFKMSCDKYDDGRKYCWLTNRICKLQCQEGYDFLKHYDNE